MKVVLVLLLSLCVYCVQPAPIAENNISNLERIGKEQFGDQKNSPNEQFGDQKDSPNDQSEDQKDSPNEQSEDQKDSPNEQSEDQKNSPDKREQSEDQKDSPNEQSQDQNDSLKEEQAIQNSIDDMSVIQGTNDTDDMLKEEKGFISKSTGEESSENIKLSIGNKTVSEIQSTAIDGEDFFSHMLRFLIGEDEDDEEDKKLLIENDPIIKQDKMENENNDTLKGKNSTNEITSAQKEDLDIMQEENNVENDEGQLVMENSTFGEKLEQIEVMKENILNLEEEIKSIQEEIETVKKGLNSSEEYGGSNVENKDSESNKENKDSGIDEENEPTDETGLSIMDQIWNYFW